MTTTLITAQSIPEDTGFSLTDATYEVMATGPGNGVEFSYDPKAKVVLNNDTAGAAIYTFEVPQPPAYAAKSAAVGDVSMTVAAGKMVVYSPSSIFKQTGGNVIVECDVAAKILVLAM